MFIFIESFGLPLRKFLELAGPETCCIAARAAARVPGIRGEEPRWCRVKQRKQAKEDWSGCGDRFYRRIRPSGLLGRTGPGRRPGTILRRTAVHAEPLVESVLPGPTLLGARQLRHLVVDAVLIPVCRRGDVVAAFEEASVVPGANLLDRDT